MHPNPGPWWAAVDPPFGSRPGHDPENWGAVIGVVDLTGAHSDDDCLQRSLDQIAALYREDPATVSAMPDSGAGGIVGKVRPCSPWAMPDHHHLVLEDPRPLARPIPAKGRLGLWRPDTDLEAAIRDQLDGGA